MDQEARSAEGATGRPETSPEAFLDGRVTLIVADVFAGLAAIDDESIDTVVTSPPYWGLRDYGVAGQIGLEPTLGEHLDVMIDVFREVRRVLKPHGTVWLNYGDCYATAPSGRSAADTKAAGLDDRTFRDKPFSTVGPIFDPRHSKALRGNFSAADRQSRREEGGRVVAGGTLKPKDLCMIPNRLAIALQDDGWWVRSEIVWAKPNAMPDSSGRYRPSTAHEKIFLLSKSADADVWRARDTGEVSFEPDLAERCPLETDPSRDAARWSRIGHYYDANAVRQGLADASVVRLAQDVDGQEGSRRANGGTRPDRPMKAVRGRSTHGRHTLGDALPEGERRDKQSGHSRRHDGFNARWEAQQERAHDPRHDGHINHTGLAELGRGEGRLLRNYEPAPLEVWEIAARAYPGAHFATFPPELAARAIKAGCPPGGRVLDPFGGAGTTALVAARLGRLATLIEINPEYAEQARARIEAEWRVVRRPTENAAAEGLFAWGGQGRDR